MNREELIEAFSNPTLEKLNAACRDTLGETLGIVITAAGKGSISGTMPVQPSTVQPFRVLHGGASVALAETLGSIGAGILAAREGKACVGLEINANHIRQMPEGGIVNGVATVVHAGRTTQVWEIKITDQANGKLVCLSRLTMAVLG